MIKSNYIPHLPTTHTDMLDTPLIPSMNIDAQLPSVVVLFTAPWLLMQCFNESHWCFPVNLVVFTALATSILFCHWLAVPL